MVTVIRCIIIRIIMTTNFPFNGICLVQGSTPNDTTFSQEISFIECIKIDTNVLLLNIQISFISQSTIDMMLCLYDRLRFVKCFFIDIIIFETTTTGQSRTFLLRFFKRHKLCRTNRVGIRTNTSILNLDIITLSTEIHCFLH